MGTGFLTADKYARDVTQLDQYAVERWEVGWRGTNTVLRVRCCAVTTSKSTFNVTAMNLTACFLARFSVCCTSWWAHARALQAWAKTLLTSFCEVVSWNGATIDNIYATCMYKLLSLAVQWNVDADLFSSQWESWKWTVHHANRLSVPVDGHS